MSSPRKFFFTEGGQILPARNAWKEIFGKKPPNVNLLFDFLSSIDLFSLSHQALAMIIDDITRTKDIAEIPVIMELLSDMLEKKGFLDMSIEVLRHLASMKPLNQRQLVKFLSRSLKNGDSSVYPLIETLISQISRITYPELLVVIAHYLVIKNRFRELSQVLVQFFQVTEDHRIDLLAKVSTLMDETVDFPKKDFLIGLLIQKSVKSARLVDGFYYHEQLARFCLNNGFLNEALLLLEVVRQRGFESAEIWEDIGDLFVLMEDGDPVAVYQQSLELNPFNDRLIVKYADFLMEEGKVHDALELLEEARSRGVESHPMIVKLAECLLLLDDPLQALTMLKMGRCDQASDARINNLLADIYLRLNNPRKSLYLLVKQLKSSLSEGTWKENTAAWKFLAMTLEHLDKWEEAVMAYDILIGLKSEDDQAWLGKMGALIELGRYEDAIREGRFFMKNRPENDEGWRLLARCYMFVKDFESSRKCLKVGLTLNPKNYRILIDMGRISEELNDALAAKSCYERALQLSPNNIIAWLRLAMLDISNGNLLESIPKLRRVLSIDADNDFATRLLAQVLLQSFVKHSHLKKKKKLVRQMVLTEMEHVFPPVQLDFIVYLIELGYHEVALDAARYLYRRQPDEPMLIIALAASLISNGIDVARAHLMLRDLEVRHQHLPELQFWLGKYELTQQNYGAALKHLSLARFLNPSEMKYWDEELWARAMSAQTMNQILPFVNMVNQMFPHSKTIKMTVAMIYYMYHRYNEAESLLNDCLDENPDMVKAWILLARIKRLKGSLIDAITTLKRGLEHNPRNPDLLEELDRHEDGLSWGLRVTRPFVDDELDRYQEFLVQLQDLSESHGLESLKVIKELVEKKEFDMLENILLKVLLDEERVEIKIFLLEFLVRMTILQFQLKKAIKYIDQAYKLDLLSKNLNELLFSIISMLDIEEESIQLLRDAVTIFQLPRTRWMQFLFKSSVSSSDTLVPLLESIQEHLDADASDAFAWMFLALVFRTFQLDDAAKRAFMHAMLLEIPENEGVLQLFIFLKQSLDVDARSLLQ